MVSYEVSMGFVIVTVLMCVGSLNLTDIVKAQETVWFFIPLFPMFVIFFISTLAETNRAPVRPAGGRERAGGGLLRRVQLHDLCPVLPGRVREHDPDVGADVDPVPRRLAPPIAAEPFTWIPGPVWFAFKIALCLFVFIWVRATFPRYRYDQLMRSAGKCSFPSASSGSC
jgi:NADH-quinone oxidoreductase subunit H